jgi:heme/copper-type cytochrome/quinol oxidase subunit 2
MSRGQRYAFLAVAVVIAVVAIVVLADSSEDDSGDQTSATSTPTATATASPTEASPAETETPTPTPTPEPKPPLLTGDKVTKLTAKEGDTVTFRVKSPEAEEVHVHGYDLKKDLEPNVVATMSFKATIPGIFEIEFEHSAHQIGELRVNP